MAEENALRKQKEPDQLLPIVSGYEKEVDIVFRRNWGVLLFSRDVAIPVDVVAPRRRPLHCDPMPNQKVLSENNIRGLLYTTQVSKIQSTLLEELTAQLSVHLFRSNNPRQTRQTVGPFDFRFRLPVSPPSLER